MRQKRMFSLKDTHIENLLYFVHFLNYHFSEKFMVNYSNFFGVRHGGEGSFIMEIVFAKILRN